jgi:hypothetical protein
VLGWNDAPVDYTQKWVGGVRADGGNAAPLGLLLAAALLRTCQ